MAGLTHLGVGLVSKTVTPKLPVWLLIIAAYLLDLVWGLFFAVGLEGLPSADKLNISPWSHSLMMAIIWSFLAAGVTWLVLKKKTTTIMIGSLVFSHWVVDFISHPMTSIFPHDVGLPLFVNGESPLVGLGLWGSQTAVNIGEYGVLILGVLLYLYTIIQERKKEKIDGAEIR